uniref:Uncharacterized protein n=1 Tax=Molossus molossus TaxID=27622 RepID=A0A7J8FT52_MOLMO|nr:hypothetical protein HJG59_008446 [Molossus molossus]
MSTVSSDPFLLGSCVHGPEDAVPCSELGAGTEGGGCRVRGAGLNGGGHGEDQASEDTRSTLATHFGSPRSKIPRPHGLLFPLDTFLSSYANSVDTEASFMRDGLRGPDRCQVMSVRRALQETDSEHLWETD